MAKERGNIIGSWAFLIGVILAVILGAIGSVTSTVVIILVVIGLIIGLLNIADTEVSPFLMSGAVLIIAASLGKDVMNVIGVVSNVLDAILALFVPATIIVAIKNVFNIAKN